MRGHTNCRTVSALLLVEALSVVAGDLHQVVPALTAEIKRRKGIA